MVFYGCGICWEAIPGMMPRPLINSGFIWDGLRNAWLKMDNNTNSRRPARQSGNVRYLNATSRKKKKTTVSGLRRLYILKERCRALKWKIALGKSLN